MTRNACRLATVAAIALALYGGQARAADPPRIPTIRTVQLQVDPAPEPRFALQYLLETPYMEQSPGNAALLYQTAIGQMLEANRAEGAIDRDTLSHWYNSPPETLPVEEVRTALSRFRSAFRSLEMAARCERCTWEYPIREEGFTYMMPQLGEYRTLSRLLCLKARLEIHDGDLDQALATLRSGVSMARDLGGGPSIIQHLVGVSIAAGMAREIEGWVQAARAPNLYWALTVLPDPLIDIRASIQMESAGLYAKLPELLTLEDKVLANEQVLDLWWRAAAMLGGDQQDPGWWLSKTMMIAGAMKLYPQAKARLIKQGHPAETVEAWPPLHVILLDQHQQFRAVRDRIFKWTYVPYTQARHGLKQADQEMSQLYQRDAAAMANPFLIFLPATQRINFLDARLAREIAMLRCVEAIRMYAADHDGKLPRSLAEISAVPVPSDPLNGGSFHYELTGGKAVLESAIPPDGGPRDGLRYEITLR
jgi:hypothetical protein